MPFFEDYGSDFHFFSISSYGSGSPEMHLHPHYEMCLVPNEYSDHLFVNGTEYTLHSPIMLLHAPFCLHKLSFVPKVAKERHVFYFGDGMLKNHPTSFSGLSPYINDVTTIFWLSEETLDELRPLTERMIQYQEDGEEQKLFFLLILNIILKSGCKHTRIGTTTQNNQIFHIVQYMYDHLAENICAESVAQEFFISRSKLNKDFRKYTTVSFHRLLLEMRICHATELLRKGEESIGNIANLSGFENESYFFTAFKKEKGISPLQYLKRYQKSKKRKIN